MFSNVAQISEKTVFITAAQSLAQSIAIPLLYIFDNICGHIFLNYLPPKPLKF